MQKTMILVTMLLVAGLAQGAAVPELLNYQARLSDENGEAWTTATCMLEFNIYDGPVEGANLVWGPESFDPVPVVEGYVNVELGHSTSLAGVFDGPSRYVGIKVGPSGGPLGAEILPRQQILSAPYAFSARSARNGVPPGAIMAKADSGGTPEGWLLCDGSPVSRTTYAALFAAIGVSWGTGDGSNTFNLPDLMDGRFLRGGTAGELQDDSTALPIVPVTTDPGEGVHNHFWTGWRAVSEGSRAVRSRETIGSDPPDDITLGDDGQHVHTLTDGDAETRPKNAAVVWIVKY